MTKAGDVLIVDGDAAIRTLLEIVVRMLPRRPVIAADGRSAMALLAGRPFDALVLELILPEVSGAEVLRFVASQVPELLKRTVVVTTMPEARWSDCAETRACWTVLRKPFALDDLQSALLSCCRGAAGT